MLQFDDVAKKLIYDFKYHYVRDLAPILSEFLADYLKDNKLTADILVPVPLHPHKLRERGYNQSALLTKELSQSIKMPYDANLLTRSVDTAPQAKNAHIETRQKNVKGAFTCDKSLKYKRILLIDDVCTTGATLNSCAIALNRIGAKSVWGLTLAREL